MNDVNRLVRIGYKDHLFGFVGEDRMFRNVCDVP